MSCFALLDDCTATAAAPSSRLYTGFLREHRCDDPQALEAVWAAVESDQRAGGHAVLLADYEWGARLLGAGDEGLVPADGGALRILIFAQLARLSAAEVEAWLQAQEGGGNDANGAAVPAGGGTAHPGPAGILALRPSVDRAEFEAAIARILAAIGDGETYQVNYTYRLDFQAFGSPVALYRRLRARQPVSFGAFIALPPGEGASHVLSCSPELFLQHRGGRLLARPMKGTACRAGVPEGDSEIARLLAGDTKNRAENLMIVDLLRNDLGRIARIGSVRVPALFSVEAYSTVFQMTSTIEAELPSDTGFPALLRALYPCGSITGAPKHRTMELIRALESTPRGLYTGSIGWIDAPVESSRACGDFCLSVTIRTLTLGPERKGLRAGRMGIGAGIVSDSKAAEEFEECALKARFLTGLDPGFTLLETLYATRSGGIRHLDRHLARLAASAAAFAFACPLEQIERALRAQLAELPAWAPSRLRLALHHDGRFDLVVSPLAPIPDEPVGLLLATEPVDGDDPFVRHKTSLRTRYDAALALAARNGAFDVLFVNRHGQLAEGARSNLFVHIDGEWRTPPLSAGVLPGVMRAALLADPAWGAREAPLTPADLLRAERIVVCNALRGPLAARMLAPVGPTAIPAASLVDHD
ncbi:MAG: chorismate-binding protein [Azoarcus sp.]|nr:chorismate-binding protein [Azoarcus sp.]